MYQAPSLTAGGHYPMTELLIGTVSWLATFGLIVASSLRCFVDHRVRILPE